MITEQEVMRALDRVMDPELRKSIVQLGMVRDVRISDGTVAFTLALTTIKCPLRERIQADARNALLALDGVREVNVEIAEMSPEEKSRLQGAPENNGSVAHLNHVKHVIAVMSGKGGVGKSLVSGLLAVSLRRSGYSVGILDADITGPSIPKMFFTNGARPGMGPAAILPAETHTGIKVMSINLILDSEDQAVIWRGPLISSAIRQFWGDVLWGSLDYMVVDLPPGTSDAALTVLQLLPMSGVLMVTSPQSLAGMVVKKGAQLVQNLDIPILGLVENMSYYLCPDTGKRHDVFGVSHAAETAGQLHIPFLGQLPIDPAITALCDTGSIERYDGDAFSAMAEKIVATAGESRPPVMSA